MVQTNGDLPDVIHDLWTVRRRCASVAEAGGVTVRQHLILSEISTYLGPKIRELQEASR